MPGIDYKKLANGVATGAFAKPLNDLPGSFYNGTPGRDLTPCPDCQRPADALFGNHGGDCIEISTFAHPKSALGIIRKAALKHRRFSMNDVRKYFDEAGVKETSRGPAFGQAVKRGWLEIDGSVRSLDPGTKGHRIQTYKSLIHPVHVKQLLASAAR